MELELGSCQLVTCKGLACHMPCHPCPHLCTPLSTADVTRVQTSPGATSGNSKLTISLRTMPKSLRTTSQQFQG